MSGSHDGSDGESLGLVPVEHLGDVRRAYGVDLSTRCRILPDTPVELPVGQDGANRREVCNPFREWQPRGMFSWRLDGGRRQGFLFGHPRHDSDYVNFVLPDRDVRTELSNQDVLVTDRDGGGSRIAVGRNARPCSDPCVGDRRR